MELNENADIDTSQVEDRRGSGGGGGIGGLPIPIGGGGIVGVIIFLVLAVAGGYFGINTVGGGESGSSADNTELQQTCGDEGAALEKLECRNTLYVNSIQAYWKTALPEHFGKDYEPATTVFFSDRVSTGCGAADSGVGPFYCPPDREVYIDLTFYDELANRFGAEGEFAAPYVIAHEYGHHVQTLLGTSDQVNRQQQRDPNNANRYSVMLELQADCYAGSWAKFATTTTDAGGQALFTSITDTDIQQAVETAEAIGDDAIQGKAGGGVNPDSFTHGSSAQRKQWFMTGYQAGDPKRCDTFSAGI
jgi:uncharacterized protein